jgi:hypothetical protein
MTGSLFRNTGAVENRRFDWMSPRRSILAMPVWALDIWNSHFDEVAAILFWLGIGSIFVFAQRERERERDSWSSPVLSVPAMLTVIVILVTPFEAGNSSFLNVRLAPVALLLLLLPLRLHAIERSWIPVSFGLFAALVASGTSLIEARAVEQQILGNIDALWARTAPNKRLAILNFALEDTRSHFWPYSFVGSYYRAAKGGVSSWGFAELVHWPLHFRPESKPPARGPFWNFEPCEYRYEEDGAYYDYVLVQGTAEPFAEGAPGPRFRLLGTSGRFQLYEKVGNASSKLEDPTMNPCRWLNEKASRMTP